MPAAPPIRLIAPDTSSAVLVAYSGGVDSTVLLHLLANDAAIRARGLRALHVHHGLQPDADPWAAHCLRVCAGLGIDCDIVQVTVERDSGMGPEAAARHARREVFARSLRSGETLALAQHRDDQAETFLLRALRASGPDGLASMLPWRPFAAGWMWRPLLDTPRAALLTMRGRSHWSGSRIPAIRTLRLIAISCAIACFRCCANAGPMRMPRSGAPQCWLRKAVRC